MALVYVSSVTHPETGKIVQEGLAEREGFVPHPLRQALQSLDVEIDAHDRVEADGLDMKILKAAYERFAGPARDRDEDIPR